MCLFVYILEHFIRLGGVDPDGANGEGVILDVAVEGGEHRTVHVLAVGELHVGAVLVDRDFKDVVVVVEHDVHEGAAALRDGFLNHFVKCCSVHIPIKRKTSSGAFHLVHGCKDTLFLYICQKISKMRKILIMLAAAAALLFGLTACDLDMVDNYSFTLAYEFNLGDETLRNEMEQYLDEFVNLPSQKAAYPNTAYAEAVYQGQELFDEILHRVDRDFILGHIQSEEDVIHLAGIVSGHQMKEVVAHIYWTWDWKQRQTAQEGE